MGLKKEDFIYAANVILSKVINLWKDPAKVNPRTILIVKYDEIGDMIYALPCFPLLKDKYKNAEITLMCKSFLGPLMQHNPHIDRVVHDVKELKSYDLIIELRGNFDTVLYALTHLPKYRVDRGTVRLRNKMNGGHPHDIFTNLQIIEPLVDSIPENPEVYLYPVQESLQKAKEWLSANGIQKFMVFHLGARKELRQWKVSNYAEVIRFLHHKYGYEIVFAGDKSDHEIIAKAMALIDFKTYSVAEKFTLPDFAALCSMAEGFIGNESGPLHIAAASKIPVLGLFGPGEPKVFYPWGTKASYLHHILECNPCDQINCVRPDFTCMDMISVEQVKQKMEDLLSLTSLR